MVIFGGLHDPEVSRGFVRNGALCKEALALPIYLIEKR